jgi:uncharacterized protein YcgI (DUF1989 family)
MTSQSTPTDAEDLILDPGGCVARELRAGQTLSITDVEGGQVADIAAFALDDLSDKMWVSNTIRLNGTVYLTKGHVLYSERSRPLLTIVEDTCGRNDILAGSCNAEIDKFRYDVDDHFGCTESFVAALEPWGIRRADVPMSLNVFMNCPVAADGTFSIVEGQSKAGDHIDFRAERDVLVAVSNCPQDLNATNQGTPTALGVTISGG